MLHWSSICLLLVALSLCVVAAEKSEPMPTPLVVKPIQVEPIQVKPLEVEPSYQTFERGSYLSEGAIIRGRIAEAIVLRRADRLAQSEVRILCGSVVVIATADKSAADSAVSVTLRRVIFDGPNGEKIETPISGFAMSAATSAPNVPCRVTDELLVTEQRIAVLLILTGPIQLP